MFKEPRQRLDDVERDGDAGLKLPPAKVGGGEETTRLGRPTKVESPPWKEENTTSIRRRQRREKQQRGDIMSPAPLQNNGVPPGTGGAVIRLSPSHRSCFWMVLVPTVELIRPHSDIVTSLAPHSHHQRKKQPDIISTFSTNSNMNLCSGLISRRDPLFSHVPSLNFRNLIITPAHQLLWVVLVPTVELHKVRWCDVICSALSQLNILRDRSKPKYFVGE